MQIRVKVSIVFQDNDKEIDAGERELVLETKELSTCEKSEFIHRINKKVEALFNSIK